MLKRDQFQQMGSGLFVAPSIKGYVNYRVRVSMEVHIENDPNLKCKVYNENEVYSKCLQEMYIEKVMEKLDCIPPWLGDDISMWCNSTFSGIQGNH